MLSIAITDISSMTPFRILEFIKEIDLEKDLYPAYVNNTIKKKSHKKNNLRANNLHFLLTQ